MHDVISTERQNQTYNLYDEGKILGVLETQFRDYFNRYGKLRWTILINGTGGSEKLTEEQLQKAIKELHEVRAILNELLESEVKHTIIVNELRQQLEK